MHNYCHLLLTPEWDLKQTWIVFILYVIDVMSTRSSFVNWFWVEWLCVYNFSMFFHFLGEDVPLSQCEDDPPRSEVACEMACPGDCVVGSWSSWSPCSHSCATKTAEGRQSRTRTVLALPGKGNLTSRQDFLFFFFTFPAWCDSLLWLIYQLWHFSS